MVFSSTIFLFAFLPLVLLAHFVCGRSLRNLVLLLFSLGFYAWGEGILVLIMVFAIVTSWLFGRILDGTTDPVARKRFLAAGILLNLLPLLYFKYAAFIGANIGLDSAGSLMQGLPTLAELPIGISFFTFQSLSYLIDVYRRTNVAQRSIFDLGLYISLFPQLIAGPIVRYKDICEQIRQRTVSRGDVAAGIERFIYGLGKKVLIANPLGLIADQIFALDQAGLGLYLAWLGVICYALQIYFDFSGYSDMAIGLGRMFGFRFLENFDFPYVSRSIREFWRRWHISLSRWFRDYLYIPLGGNRVAPWRVSVNLLTVFVLCGLWHGASWNFIVWGLFHGGFLALERGRFGGWVKSWPAIFQHAYVLLVVLVAWVFFRTETMAQSEYYVKAMFDLTLLAPLPPHLAIQLDLQFYSVLALALILSAPVYRQLRDWAKTRLQTATDSWSGISVLAARQILAAGIFSLAVFDIALGSYSPFIYFRF